MFKQEAFCFRYLFPTQMRFRGADESDQVLTMGHRKLFLVIGLAAAAACVAVVVYSSHYGATSIDPIPEVAGGERQSPASFERIERAMPSSRSTVDTYPSTSSEEQVHQAPAKGQLPTNFSENVIRLWSLSGDDLLKLYIRGVNSDLQTDTLLAYLAYDTCRQFIEPTVFAEMSNLGGSALRRSQDSRRKMRERCAPFLSIRKEDQIRDYISIKSRYSSPEFEFSNDYFDLPRNPSDADRSRVNDRLVGAYEAYGQAALMWTSAALSSWLEDASRPGSGVILNPILLNTGTLTLATYVAACDVAFCGPDSNFYGVNCGVHGSCPDEPFADEIERLPEEAQRKRVKAQASFIVNVLRSGNLRQLGLRPR